MKRILLALIGIIIIGAIAAGGYWYWSTSNDTETTEYATIEETENVYVRLGMEAYDVIKENYWQEVDDAALADLYRLSLMKASGDNSITLASTTRSGVATMLDTAIDAVSDPEQKKALILQTITVALYNLAPAGRSQLYTQVDEAALRNRVANVDPESNLYAELGLEAGANTAAVQDAYEEKREELAASSSPEAAAELERVAYAHEVLANESSKNFYDEAKIEPTVSSRVYGDSTLYIDLNKIAPTSLQEFVDHIGKRVASTTLDNLIIDLRGNEGGALDFAPYMLGIFIGPNQYAADLFHRGEREVLRTPEHIPRVTEVQNFKEIVILTDSITQSTAELTAAIFKRLNMATVIGTKTRGWGSVENTFPLETKITEEETYLLFLVHSLTLRDDQQPIEESGVIPDISVEEDGWQSNLPAFVDSAELRNTVINLYRDEEGE